MGTCPLPGIAERMKDSPAGKKLQDIINEQKKLSNKIDFNGMLGIEEDTQYKEQIQQLTDAVSKYKDLITADKASGINVMRGVLKDAKGNDITYKGKDGKEYKKYNPFGNPFHKWSVGEGKNNGELSVMFYNWITTGEVPTEYNEKDTKRLDRQRKELLNSIATLAGKKLYYEGTARGKDLSHALVLAMLADQVSNKDKELPEISNVNVYHSTNENAVLSNLYYRPFTFKDKEFVSVEHAYQSLKSGTGLEHKVYNDPRWGQVSKGKTIKVVGSKGTKTEGNWNIGLMKILMTESFKQNVEAQNALLATGNSIITHVQDKGVWKTAFPKILMKIRENLQNSKAENKADNDTISLASLKQDVVKDLAECKGS